VLPNPISGKHLRQLLSIKCLILLATPAGFEPATFSLEGYRNSNDINAEVDKFIVCTRIDAVQ